MSESFHLETPRLVLRSFRDDDLPVFVAYRSDPEVARFQAWDAPFPEERAREFLKDMRHIIPGLPGEWYQVAIERKEDGALLGDCAFSVLAEDNHQAEIGFTLARQYQGKGYATEAVGRLLEYLFDDLGLHRVRAVCDVENQPSARLMERLGMRREGCMLEAYRTRGGWRSEYHYAILNREWAPGPYR